MEYALFSLERSDRHFFATTSAANTAGFPVRAFRIVRRISTSENPTARNSFRKAPPSFAPATHANQVEGSFTVSGGSGSRKMSSAT